MLSIVNYGSSDSENEISDEELEVAQIHRHTTQEENDDFLQKPSTINLPQPSAHSTNIEEEDDEFLRKKEIPKAPPPPTKAKVKIMIPRLSDFRDEDDDDAKQTKILPSNKKTGLLDMLPKPSLSFGPSPKPQSVTVQQKAVHQIQIQSQETPSEAPKKVGLIPYALMSHKPKTSDTKKPMKDESDDDDHDETVGSFFTFTSNDDELPKVNEEEVKALVEKEAARMEQRKRQNEESEQSQLVEDQMDDYDQYEHRQQNIDEEAMKALLGGNKAKRSKIDNIQFIDLSAAEVMPDKGEWLRKSLAGETSYQPTGHISEKVRTLTIYHDDVCSFFHFFFRVRLL